jgi:lysophospholipase L1-like esterase
MDFGESGRDRRPDEMAASSLTCSGRSACGRASNVCSLRTPPRRHARRRRAQAVVLGFLIATLASLAGGTAAQADDAPLTLTPPKAYYLALGDSLAYGMQQAKFNSEFPNVDPASFDTGYVDDFAAKLKGIGEGIKTVNLGCPGESSDSLIVGGPSVGRCGTGAGFPFTWLHHPYVTGTQLGDAVAFLTAHSRQTSPVTVDIGAVDLQATEQQCAISSGGTNMPAFLECLQLEEPITIAHIASNLAQILGRVRTAAPTTGLIVVGLYNAQFTLPGADQLIEGLFNTTMAGVAKHYGAVFADPFQTIDHGAAYPDEPTSVCSQIAICTPLHDFHPFDNGYAAIAEVIYQASGYSVLE